MKSVAELMGIAAINVIGIEVFYYRNKKKWASAILCKVAAILGNLRKKK